MSRRSQIIMSIIGIVLISFILIGFTYGYYLTNIKGNSNNKSISVTTANLKLNYSDGNGIIIAENIYPGQDISNKSFSVTNDGNIPVEYIVVVEDVINTFSLRNDLIYTLTCKSVNKKTGAVNSTCSGISNASFPTQDSVLINNNINENIRHEYTLNVVFKESNKNQSIDMNKVLNAKVNIYDRKDYIEYLTDKEEMISYLDEIGHLEDMTDNYIKTGSINPVVNSLDNDVKIQFLSDTTYLIDKNTWLLFSSISKASYNTSSWTEVAGPIDSTFVSEISKKGYSTEYLINKKYLASDMNEYSSLTHFSASLAAQLYNTDALVNFLGYTEEEFNDLAGWAGDLQTLIINNLKKQISSEENYEEIYNKMSELIGKSGTYFDSDDLYADIDAVNIYYLLYNNRNKKIKDIMTNYFTTQYKDRFSMFIKNIAGSLNYDALKIVVEHYTTYKSYWKLYTSSFSKTVGDAARDSFIDYLWYKANNKELNIFTETLEFKKGNSVKFKAEYISKNNQLDTNFNNDDYNWKVTKLDGSNCLSTINNDGTLNIDLSETTDQILITTNLKKSNKVTGSKIINLT